jgi:hypothetical protein
VPLYEGDIPPIGRPDRYEELTWEPGRTHDHNLLMYLRAARYGITYGTLPYPGLRIRIDKSGSGYGPGSSIFIIADPDTDPDAYPDPDSDLVLDTGF